jgi:hypothetical protein
MDRFRIIALEKTIANPDISSENKNAAVLTLLEKIDIYIQGAEKRGKEEDVELYMEKRSAYLEILDSG